MWVGGAGPPGPLGDCIPVLVLFILNFYKLKTFELDCSAPIQGNKKYSICNLYEENYQRVSFTHKALYLQPLGGIQQLSRQEGMGRWSDKCLQT